VIQKLRRNMKIEIKSRFDNNKVLVSGKYENIKECLEKNRDAYLRDANLRDANLQGANLRGAYLRGAYLRGANLWGADLWGAYLQDADLRGAYLWSANLRDANLQGADLQGADLWNADLQDADLRDAYLRDANLRDANLRDANLRGADLQGADLWSANLQGAKGYLDSHDFFQEVVRQQKIDTFTQKEWSIIGQIIIHKLCWDSIRKRFNKSAMGIFKKLSKVGFEEWEEKYDSTIN